MRTIDRLGKAGPSRRQHGTSTVRVHYANEYHVTHGEIYSKNIWQEIMGIATLNFVVERTHSQIRNFSLELDFTFSYC